MESPELLLSSLNRALRELRGALPLLQDPAVEEELTPIMRRLLLAEVLGAEWVVAIGGSQGAGKTTLLRTMYALTGHDAEWLQPNEGQGECLPVLIVEEPGRERIQGAVRSLIPNDTDGFELATPDVTLEEFHRAVRNPRPSQLLPVLKVPQRYFQLPHQAWLLLPGYEQEDRENKEWQQLMRQALVGAAGCILVTDETRMANKEQAKIVADMRANELRGAQFMVVISKTEATRGQPERQEALCSTAREVFEVGHNQCVICAGSDDPTYVKEWLPRFELAAKDLARCGGGNRATQHALLERTLKRDLATITARLQTKAKLLFHQKESDAGTEVVQACLEAFDEECSDLRIEYQKQVGDMLDHQYDGGRKHLDELLKGNHEGPLNHIKDFFRTATESWQRVEQDVSNAWDSPGSVLDAYAEAVGKITQRKLEAPAAVRNADSASQLPSENSAVQRLGYADGGEVQPWSRPDAEDMCNLAVLFPGRSKSSPGDRQHMQRTTARLERGVKLLPVLALEYARAASLIPALVGVDPTTKMPVEIQQRPDLIEKGVKDLGNGVDLGRTVLRGVAAVLTLDFAADGQIDLPSILTSTVAGTPGAAATGAVSVGSAVVALVAVGYLAHSAIRDTRQHDEKARRAFLLLLQNLRDQHQLHFMNNYDELMRQMRACLQQALRERYHLDEVLMEKDRLAKALADVRVLSRDLVDELDRSGRSTSLFNLVEEPA